jgi:N utilization substance protein B
MVVSRRQARVFAMQVLYGIEITGCTPGEAIPAVLASDDFQKPMQAYGMKLVDLVLEHRGEFETLLRTMSLEWDVERMALLDKILILLGFVELSFVVDVPAKVVFQEMVQIANKYSTEQSGKFVNGILNQFARDRKMLGEEND